MSRLRRSLLTSAVALAGAFAAAAPAPAASDGTSNTLMAGEFGVAPVTSIKPGATRHQVVVTLANAPAGLVAGRRYDAITFSSSYWHIYAGDVLISSVTSGPVRSLTLNFTAIEFKNTGFMDYTDDAAIAFGLGGQEGEE